MHVTSYTVSAATSSSPTDQTPASRSRFCCLARFGRLMSRLWGMPAPMTCTITCRLKQRVTYDQAADAIDASLCAAPPQRRRQQAHATIDVVARQYSTLPVCANCAAEPSAFQQNKRSVAQSTRRRPQLLQLQEHVTLQTNDCRAGRPDWLPLTAQHKSGRTRPGSALAHQHSVSTAPADASAFAMVAVAMTHFTAMAVVLDELCWASTLQRLQRC